MTKLFSVSHISTGFVAVLVGYTSAAALVYQAALAGGADAAQVSSWMWAVGVGMGVTSIILSVYFKQPILVAWSTPGAALLILSLPGVAMSDAIGAFLFCSGLIVLCGVTGWFDRLMKMIPFSLAAAMLAGVLLQFGLNVFSSFETNKVLVAAMLTAYIVGRWRAFKYTIPATLAFGVLVAFLQGNVQAVDQVFELTVPVWVSPTFDLSIILGIGLPLFIVTMASQNMPGIGVLRAHGYHVPASPLITWTGICGLLTAPFGGYAFNLAAITAAICMGEDVDKDPKRRYMGSVWAGVFYILVGMFGAAVAAFFTAFPAELVATIAGLALLGTIANSLQAALDKVKEREAAMLTFAVTASGMSFLTIGSSFWGLVLGLVVHYVMQKNRPND